MARMALPWRALLHLSLLTLHGALSAAALGLVSQAKRRHAVFTVACGYSKGAVYPFVTSLRRTGYKGDILMATQADLTADLRHFLEKNKVTMKTQLCQEQMDSLLQGQVLLGQHGNRSLSGFADRSSLRELAAAEIDGCGRLGAGGATALGASSASAAERRSLRQLPGRFGGSLCQTRAVHYKRWLEEGSYDAVWLLDARDVYFQQDPFHDLRPGVSLFVDWQENGEVPKYERMQLNSCDPSGMQLVRRTLTPNVCGGTLGGTRHAMLHFLDRLIDKIMQTREKPGCKEQDQHVLISTVASCAESADCMSTTDIHIHEHFEGPALNTGTLCNERNGVFPADFLDAKGRPVNKDGRLISVIHKWDRCRYLKDRLRTSGLLLE